MVDTHSHIYGAEFDDDRDEVISRALASGVEKILLPNINEESISSMRTGRVVEYPSTLLPIESPTSIIGTPASSARRAKHAS